MRRSRYDRGFTLVELLVVIAIIGTLIAILLPAVQAAREMGRRAVCSNSLKNLSLAAQHYNLSLGSYPSGWICSTDAAGNVVPYAEGWGWGALVLPYLEQRSLHTQLTVVGSRLDSRLADIAGEMARNRGMSPTHDSVRWPLKIFICASDSGYEQPGRVDAARAFMFGNGTSASGVAPINVGVSSYVGVAGHRFVSGTIRNTGMFYGNSGTRDADIKDGLSNTAMIGERETQICHSGTWLGVENPAGLPIPGLPPQSGFSHVVGYSYPKLNLGTLDPMGTSTIWHGGCGAGFSSNHPGVAQFAFVDGSIRVVQSGVNWNYQPIGGPGSPPQDALNHRISTNGVYQAMMSINDNVSYTGP
jgi:prepilin-type N-terminal cleavage/methylation domain-containing protein